MTTTFYAPPSSVRGSHIVLPEEEAHHAARVLRKQPGDEIVVVDGEGGWHRVRLMQVDRQGVGGTIVETRREVGEPAYRLTVGLGLLKNRNRFETFLEKAVELGVGCIVPLRTARTEKESLREQRAENILVAAMKQSGRSRLTELAEPQSLDAFLEAEAPGRLLVCHERAEGSPTLLEALAEGMPERLAVLVGPEGGFTGDEVESVLAAGGEVVSLGPRRLRAETAALVAASIAMLVGA